MNDSNYLVFKTMIGKKFKLYYEKVIYIQVLYYSWFGINKTHKSQIQV